jgi:hypothetical protein
MKLPNKESAYIPYSKLVDYLLSQTHAVGKSKSKFFRKFGFDEMNVDVLGQALKKIAREGEIIEKISSPHGEKYIIDGVMQTPIGREITVRTVWIIEKNELIPRLVTAHPA